MSKNRYITSGALLLIGASLMMFSFQNCAPGGFQSDADQVNLACGDSMCIESTSSTDSSSRVASTGSTKRSNGSTTTQASQVAPSGNSTNTSQFYNVVSGISQAHCEESVATHYKRKVTCTIGGGCGVSCGKPSGLCESANPSHYGICMTKEELISMPMVSASTGAVASSSSSSSASSEAPAATPAPAAQTPAAPLMYNFVAGDKTSCETSIALRLKVRSISCRVGGGCGLSCGKPNSTCESANYTHFGACVSEKDIGDAKIADVVNSTTSQLFNVVGSKDNCEGVIRARYGVSISCSLGGGCGSTCGKPGGNCLSANPKKYGACFSEADVASIKNFSANRFFSYVAKNKATCEELVKKRLNIRVACTVGGACGSCGFPGVLCPTSDPKSYGACIEIK